MDKTVLITGATRGLGLALATRYLETGFRVFASARAGSDRSPLTGLGTTYGEALRIIDMDVSVTDSVRLAVEEVLLATDKLDLVINNAAAHPVDSFKPLEEIQVDNCLEILNINTLGPLRVVQAFLPLLQAGHMKTVVNISSESGSIVDCHRTKEYAYCMSKAALNMESVLLNNYLGERGIRILAVHPGWIRTDMGGPRAHFAPAEAADTLVKTIDRTHAQPDGPVFVNYDGSALNY